MIDKIQGCMIGGAIGDALGYQIEFKKNIRDKQVTQYKADTGIISDDTQMTLFTANALIWNMTNTLLNSKSVDDYLAVYHAYLDWFDTQEGRPSHRSISWIKKIPELNKMRAPGNTCLKSLQSKNIGTIESRINDSKGCGSIMRIAPCALMANDATESARLATQCGAITHGHILALLPCYVCAHMIYTIVFEHKDMETALQEAVQAMQKDKKFFCQKWPLLGKNEMKNFIKLIDRAVVLSKKEMTDIDAIKLIGEGWVAEEAFAIALYSCLKYPSSFKDTIVCAVNHDGDSDSTGAIAGNIIGAYLGIDNIDAYYKENVELKDIILELSNDMWTARNLTLESLKLSEAWIKKYKQCVY